MKRVMTFVILGVFVFVSCSKDSGYSTTPTPTPTTPDCTGVTVSFSTEVNPIIQGTCATNSDCHGSGSINGPHELLTYSQISSNKDAIQSAVITGRMPKVGSLSAAQKKAIYCWVKNGGLNN